MSMLSKQILMLNDEAVFLEQEDERRLASIIRQAADTIETLSAKLAAANMERSERYYSGGWIPCSYKLPPEKGKYWITYFWGDEERVNISEFENGKFTYAVSIETDVVAWKSCTFPEPYKPKE